MAENRAQPRHRKDDLSLDGLSFLLADVQDNLGNFLTAFLTLQHWPSNRIGVAIAAGGLGAVLARFVGGWTLDIVARRRLMLALCCVVTCASVGVMAWLPLFYPILLAHFIAGGAGALFTPILAAISQHTAGAKGYIARMGRNESFNHLGNASSGLLMSILGKMMGPVAPLWGVGGLAAVSLLLVGGFSSQVDEPPEHSGKSVSAHETLRAVFTLLSEPRLTVFLATYLLFNMANGAVVPLMIERYAFLHLGNPATVPATCIVVAQITMVPVAYLVGKKAPHWPRKPLFVLALALQPVRDSLVVLSAGWPALIVIQILDGLSSGIILVLFYAILADIAVKSGRRNLLIGLGLALGTVGALLSNLASGMLTSSYGFSMTFVALGVAGVIVAGLFALGMPETHSISSD
ncbi:MFS transporter [Gluconobacter frateurii]|uniref:MFS transporter n=1 Tax=Gluconobacter frateurii TaxID=38308 RepID=UPI000C07CB7C|nr:MFS transporter [Gluconobacter frateurii]GLP91783.1 MFS transporter [Gluconobacter frateurii]